MLQALPTPAANKICTGFKISSNRGQGMLGGSGNGMQCLLCPGEQLQFSPGEQPLQSCYYSRAAQKPARNEDQWLRSSSRLCHTTCPSFTWHRRAAPQKSTEDGVVQPALSPLHVAQWHRRCCSFWPVPTRHRQGQEPEIPDLFLASLPTCRGSWASLASLLSPRFLAE